MTADDTILGAETVLWRLEDLYSSPRDEQIADDLDLCAQEVALLEEGFGGRLAELEPAAFARMLRRMERIEENLGRVGCYAFLHFTTQVGNAEAGAFLQRITEAASQINRRLVFFPVEWGRLDEAVASHLLQAPETQKYHHYLKKIRRQARHLLSQSEEKLLVERAPVGRHAWITLFEKILGQQKFGKQGRSEEEVLADLYSPRRRVRRKAARDLTRGLQAQLPVLTHIFNTLAADKMIDDRLRSYPAWDRSMHLENELEPATVETLVDCVTGRYDLVARYYRLKRGMLGHKKLRDYDRYAPVPGQLDRRIPWALCRKMVLDAFAGFSPEMAEIAGRFFTGQWIHAPVVSGKRGGAFAHPCVPDSHPFVMVNYTGNLRDVETVAHELGHGVHQVLAAGQGMWNSDTALVLAETASVFAELLVFHSQLRLLERPEERRAHICGKIESIFATVFRQVAMNRFEDRMHTARREQGELAIEQLSAIWLDTQRAMFGDSVELSEEYSIWWSYIPHFLSTPGYVYSYAFGELLVLGLYRLYQQEGDAFVAQYMDLLRAGGSASPYELLAPFGLDINQPSFWQGGLTVVEDLVTLAEQCGTVKEPGI